MALKRKPASLFILLFLAVSSTATSHPLHSEEEDTVQAPSILNTNPDHKDATRYVRLDDMTESLEDTEQVVVPVYLQGTEVPTDEYREARDRTRVATGGKQRGADQEGWGMIAVKAVLEQTRSWRVGLGRIWGEAKGDLVREEEGDGEGNVIGGRQEDL
jgi:hypothetical protein